MVKKTEIIEEIIKIAKEIDDITLSRNFLKQRTINELNRSLEHYRKRLEDMKYEKAVEDYYSTEEGISFKTNIEREISNLQEQYVHTIEYIKNELAKNLYLDDQWNIKLSYSPNYVNICFTYTEGGYEFNAVCDAFEKIGPVFQANYPTYGHFDIMNANSHMNYLIKMGEVLKLIKNSDSLREFIIESIFTIGNLKRELANKVEKKERPI